MKALFRICLAVLVLIPLPSAGAGGGVIGLVKKLGTFIDSMSVSGVDRRYIEGTREPWQVMVRGNVNQSDLKLKAVIPKAENIFEFMAGEVKWEPRVKTDPSTYAGVWAGYRGYGLGYSWNLGGDKGRIFTIGATGGSYGVNLRIHWFDNDEPQVTFAGNALTDYTDDWEPVYQPFTLFESIDLGSPIKTRALFLDGYYLLNGKKCSYAAAYDQSVRQKRSAGSLVAGAMYFHLTTAYDTNANADLILFMDDVGKIKNWQASAGLGYIYNWVPVRGLLVSAMAIPMVTFFNHYKVWRYDSRLKNYISENGLGYLDEMGEEEYEIWPAKENAVMSQNSRVSLNVDTRLSVTYEWNNRFFFNAYGQFCNFHFKTSNFSSRLNDWYINAALGVRL